MENKKKYVKIKFIPTGLEFDVLEKEASELLKNEPENFEAVDGYTLPVEPEEPTVYSSIVVEEEATEVATSNTNNKNKKK